VAVEIRGASDLFVQRDHILCDAQYPFSQRPWREDLDLVAVAQNPPGDFAQAVHAELDGGRAVVVESDLLGAVPPHLGDVLGHFGQESELDVVDLAFRYHRPGPAEVLLRVELLAVGEAFVRDLQRLDAVELEGADTLVQTGVAEDVPGPLVVEEVIRRQLDVDDFAFGQ